MADGRWQMADGGWRRFSKRGLRGAGFLGFGIPVHGLAVSVGFDGHLDRYHGGAAEVGITGESILAAEDVYEVAFEVAALAYGEADFFFAVVFGFEFVFEIAVPAEHGFAAQFHGPIFSIDSVGQSRIVGQGADEKEGPLAGIIGGHEEGVWYVSSIFLYV